jgi:hypothetical protein
MLKLRIFFVPILFFIAVITISVRGDTPTNDGFVGSVEVEPLKTILLPSESTTFTLTGEYSKKPIATNEIKPGDPEWNLTAFSSDKTGVTLSQTDGITGWSTTNTRFVKAQTTTSTSTDDYKLTFTMKVRFPKIKKSDNTQLVINGVKQYFGPYTCSAAADLKVIKIIIKRKVAGQGDFVTISDTQNVSSVIVGQKIELKVEVKPDNTEFSNVWTITSGNPIKDYQPTTEKAEVKNLTDTDYSQKTITYYYTAGGNTNVKSTVTVDGKNKEKNAGFGIKKPKIAVVGKDNKSALRGILSPGVHVLPKTMILQNQNISLNFMTSYWKPGSVPAAGNNELFGIFLMAALKQPSGVPGEISFVQLVKSVQTYNVLDDTATPPMLVVDKEINTNGEYYLDDCIPFRSVTKSVDNASLETPFATDDSPDAPIQYPRLKIANNQIEVISYTEVSVENDFKVYLMYQPTTYPNGIRVTLGTFEWQMSGKAENGVLKKSSLTKNPVIGTENDKLPVWKRRMSTPRG